MIAKKARKHFTPFQIIINAFASVILAGAFVLMLPISSASGHTTPFTNALFTSTSAVCVTGLIVYDTASYWSYFGQGVLLVLIQIGGLGVITMTIAFAVLMRQKIGLAQRSTMQEAIAAPQIGGIVKFTSFIIKTVFALELTGAAAMAPVFCHDFGIGKGIWYSIFHSVSAFCNAGFDLMGAKHPYSSMSYYADNAVIMTVIPLLIVIGGIGFLTINDILTHKWHFRKYRMQSKVILATSLILIVVPFLYLRFGEFGNAQWGDMPAGQKNFGALFQSVTTRTAGFNSVDLTMLGDIGYTLFIILMLIGGSPGSTAGGMKTTTAAVLIISASSVFKREDNAHCFGRRLSDDAVKNAATVLSMYVILFLASAISICAIENLPLKDCLFETASAIGTVGLTLGITSKLGVVSKLILMALMFFGRVGGLTLIYAAVNGSKKTMSKLPQEKIAVG